jgi:hypothetical protein
MIIHREQAEDQVIKIRSVIAFCVISVFFGFLFLHLLTLDHPQNQSNLVCLTLVLRFVFIFRFCIFCLSLTLTGDGRLPHQQTDNFVDDPEKLYRLRRREAQQAKMLDFIDSKSEDEGSLESPKKSPPQSPRENRLPPMGDQPQERKIGELCTPDIVDLPILNLADGATFTLHR